MFGCLDHVASGVKILNSVKACPKFDFSSIPVENKVNIYRSGFLYFRGFLQEVQGDG